MTNNTITWNKIIALCSAFGIPAIGVVFALVVWGVRLDDRMTNMIITQEKQGNSIENLNDKIDRLSIRVDTVAQRQKDDKREQQYLFKELEHKKK